MAAVRTAVFDTAAAPHEAHIRCSQMRVPLPPPCHFLSHWHLQMALGQETDVTQDRVAFIPTTFHQLGLSLIRFLCKLAV